MKKGLLFVGLFLFLGLLTASSVQAATLDTTTITDISSTVVAANKNNVGLLKLVLQDGDAGNLTSVEVHFTAEENDLDRVELWTDNNGDGSLGMGDQTQGYTGSSDGSVNALDVSGNANFTHGNADGGIGTGNIFSDIDLTSSQTLFIVIETSAGATNDDVITAQIAVNKIVAGSDSGPAAPSVEASLTIDSVAPEVTGIEYQDIDGNGSVDSLEITFSEALDIIGEPSSSTDLNDFSYTAGDITDSVLSGGSAAYTDSTHLLITLGTPGAANITSHDTAPTLTHTFSSPMYQIMDNAGNNLTDFEAMNIDDGAAPYLISGVYGDENDNGKVDKVILTFSESATFTYETGDWDFSVAGDVNLTGDFSGSDCTTGSTTITCTDLDNSDLSADSNKTGKQTAGGSEPSWHYQNLGTTGSIKDSANNEMSEKTIALGDTAKPILKSSTPSNGEDAYSLSGSVTLNFSEMMSSGTLNATKITCSPSWGSPVFTISANEDSVEINPVADFSSATSYEVTVGATVADAQSNNFAGQTITFLTLPSAPTSLVASNLTTSEATVSWTAPGGTIASYVLEYSKNADFSGSTTVSDLATTSTGLTGLNSNTTYYFRVKAYSGSGYSAYSTAESFTTSATEDDPETPEEPGDDEEEAPDEETEEPINTIEDISLISGSESGAGIITLYDNSNEELCSVQAWNEGGAVPFTVRFLDITYVAVVKNKVGSTIHLYDLNCNLVEKKKLSAKLHPRNMITRNFLGKSTSQEIALTSRRGSTVYGKIFRYNPNKDKWYLVKQKTFRPVPLNYTLDKTKKGNILIKNNNKTLYKWEI